MVAQERRQEGCCEHIKELQKAHDKVAQKVWMGVAIISFVILVILPFIGWTANTVNNVSLNQATLSAQLIELKEDVKEIKKDVRATKGKQYDILREMKK
jgi:outer membrane murein-binding lipoprotein Lpp